MIQQAATYTALDVTQEITIKLVEITPKENLVLIY